MSSSPSLKRRVLLVVSGMSPQILTETLWALTQDKKPFVPTEIVMVTTSSGARNAELHLLSAEKGHFHKLCAEYNLSGISFSAQSLRVITDPNGMPLDDIRTEQQNEYAADFITQTVREITEDDECALHISMAGGRKTMGYFVAYALSLFGREQDSLSHVLVSEPFENCREFFYPAPKSRLIDINGAAQDAHLAEVTLAKIPFVRLRDDIPTGLLEGKSTFSETIEQAQALNTKTDTLINIGISAKTITICGKTIPFAPGERAFYAWVIQRQLQGKSPISVLDFREDNSEFAQEFIALLEQLEGEMGRDIERTEKGLAGGMPKSYFEEKKSRVQKRLAAALGNRSKERFGLMPSGPRGRTEYRILIEDEQIEWHN